MPFLIGALVVVAVAAPDFGDTGLAYWYVGADAVPVFETLLPAGSVREVWTFFPDPWPKTKHHKRRIVQPAFASLVARVLEPGGLWRLATDWSDYAESMLEVLDAHPDFEGGEVERFDVRPMTRFERRGIAAGRSIHDLTYRRR